MEDEQLVKWIDKSKRGDKRAFESLVNTFQPMVFRLAFRMLNGDMDEAKDMVQEVFLKVWVSIPSYNSSFRFSTWLYKITNNACLDRLRVYKQRREDKRMDWEDALLRLSSGEDIESELINKDLRKIILHLMESLPSKQKIVFILSDIEELDVSEIVKITSLSPGKIKSNLYLARKFIKNQLLKTM